MNGKWKRLLAAVLAAGMILGDSSFAYAAESQLAENASESELSEVVDEEIVDEEIVELPENEEDDEEQGKEETDEDSNELSEDSSFEEKTETDEEEEIEETAEEENSQESTEFDTFSLKKSRAVERSTGEEWITAGQELETDAKYSKYYFFQPEESGYYGFTKFSEVDCLAKKEGQETWDYENDVESYYKLSEEFVAERYFYLESGKTYRFYVRFHDAEETSLKFNFLKDEEGDTAKKIELDGDTISVTGNETMLCVEVTEGCIAELVSDKSIWIQCYGFEARTCFDNVIIFESPGKAYFSVGTYENTGNFQVSLKTLTYDGTLELGKEETVPAGQNGYFSLELEKNAFYYSKGLGWNPYIYCLTENNECDSVYERSFTDAEGTEWNCFEVEESYEKIIILVPNYSTEDISFVLQKELPMNKQLSEWSDTITVPANSSVEVGYRGNLYGDYLIKLPENTSQTDFFTSLLYYNDSTEIIDAPLIIDGEKYQGFYSDYGKGKKEFGFRITNNTDSDQTLTLCTNQEIENSELQEEKKGTLLYKTENGEKFGYFKLQPTKTKIYETKYSDYDWIYCVDGENRTFLRESTVVFEKGKTYYLKLTAEKEFLTTTPEAVSGKFIEFNPKKRFYSFTPSVSGNYGYDSAHWGMPYWDNTKKWWRNLDAGETIYLEKGTEYIVDSYYSGGRFAVKNDITVLDYDYYQAFIASGGFVTVDGENVEISQPNCSFTFVKKLLSLFGFVKYTKQDNTEFMNANEYWKNEEDGYFAASKYFKFIGNGKNPKLVSCNQEEIKQGDVVVIKYEPEIIWVDSMNITADTTLAVGEKTQLRVEAKAATEKYSFEKMNTVPVFTYRSSDEDILTVDQTGKVTAHKKGTATIIVEADKKLRIAENCVEKLLTDSIEITVGNKYQIFYQNVDGPEGCLAEDSPQGYDSAAVKLVDAIASEGYEFAGWYSDAKLTKRITSIAKNSKGDKTVYAKWNLKNYEIDYELEEGHFQDDYPLTFTMEGGTLLEDPIWYGHEFKGWYYEEEELPKDETTGKYYIPAGIKENIRIISKWESKVSYTLKLNAEDNLVIHSYSPKTKNWESTDLFFTIEKDPIGIEVIVYEVSAALYKKDTDEPIWKNLENAFKIPADKIAKPGKYILKASVYGEALEPVEFEVKLEKREYPIEKEFTWNAIRNENSEKTFEDISAEIVNAIQPSDDAFFGLIGEKRVESEKIEIISVKNSKNKEVDLNSKIVSGTYTVTFDIGKNEYFYENATAEIKVNYEPLTAAGVAYETADAARTAGNVIAFGVGEEKKNTTLYPSSVIIIPKVKTPWGTEVTADKLVSELETNGYKGYTVSVYAESNAKRELLDIKTDETKAEVRAVGETAGKANITVTTTISSSETETPLTLSTVVKNFTVVSGAAEATKKITLNLVGAEEYRGTDDEERTKTYLLKKSDTAKIYELTCATVNYNEEENVPKLTWKSSNTKIASVKTQKDTNDVTVTIPKNASGVVEITATAKDAGKKSQSIKLVIVDASMRMDTTNLVTNSVTDYHEMSIDLYPNVLAEAADGSDDLLESIIKKYLTNEISVNLYKKVKNPETKKYEYELYDDVFSWEYFPQRGKLCIEFKEPAAKAQTYTVCVGVLRRETGEQPSEVYTLKIKDTCKMPKNPSVKAVTPYEMAYEDNGYAEMIMTLDLPAAMEYESDRPMIQTQAGEKFEVIGWEDIGLETCGWERAAWKLKVAVKEKWKDSVLPTGKQTSKTIKGVKFDVVYEGFRKAHTCSANITITKTIPKLSVYGRWTSAPTYYTDVDVRTVDVVIPITERMASGVDKEQLIDNLTELQVSEDGVKAYWGDNTRPVICAAVTDPSKFEIISADYTDDLAMYSSNKIDGKDAILLKIRIKDGQTKTLSLQFTVESSAMSENVRVTTGKISVKAAKLASESISIFDFENEKNAVKSLNFSGVYQGKEKASLKVKPKNFVTEFEESLGYTYKMKVEGADVKSKAMLKKDILLIETYENDECIFLKATEKAFDYTGCKLKISMQVTDESGRTVNTKSVNMTVNFKKLLTPRISLSNVKLARGVYSVFDEMENQEKYESDFVDVNMKISDAPMGSRLSEIRFADPADRLKYVIETDGRYMRIRQCPETALSLGKDTLGLIFDFLTENGDVISTQAKLTINVVDNVSLKASDASINLYNSTVGSCFGKDIVFYDRNNYFAVKVKEIVNAEELKKAGIGYEILDDAIVNFYVDETLERGIEKTYTVKAKVGAAVSVTNDAVEGQRIAETSAEKIISFKIVLKK